MSDDDFSVDYEALIARGRTASPAATIEGLSLALPKVWLASYHAMCDGPTNVHQMEVDGYEYLFDHASELATQGLPSESHCQENRVVGVFGLSRPPQGPRDATRIRGFPSKPTVWDRGHFIAHAAGGELDVNLFHQEPALNRGWSSSGKIYRQMEAYCGKNPGTFFFSRPIYRDLTSRPPELEFGVLRNCESWWVNRFDNSLP